MNNKQQYELEMLTIEFLKKHDPNFSKKGPKPKTIKYPYLSESQFNRRFYTEITLTNLTYKQTIKARLLVERTFRKDG